MSKIIIQEYFLIEPLKNSQFLLLFQLFIGKRHIAIPKITLSEDKKEGLDLRMQSVQPGTILTVVYYQDNKSSIYNLSKLNSDCLPCNNEHF